ncbi:MAG: DUF4838 domain-containing protein [Candidatus Magnetomorum sp.]|nr:DUF4838 domain-containing protein [Candidatus Magnetomorum sp.]
MLKKYPKRLIFKFKHPALILLFMVVFSLFTPNSNAQPPLTYRLVEDTVPLAAIEILSSQPQSIDKMAHLLQTYIKKSTGATLPIIDKMTARLSKQYPVCIHITVNQSADAFSDNSDRFVMDFSIPNHIWITGESETGTEFGVYDFLERFVGIRWLFPGPLGEHIPHHRILEIKSASMIESPVFKSRQISGLIEQHQQWKQRHRIHERIRFMHNLHNIFPVDPYLKTHPHLFPHKNSKPNVPYPTIGWQPCVQEPDAITIAVQHINTYFQKNPSEQSYSLGPNDAITSNSGYCISDQEALQHNAWGYPYVSDRYFQWANQVVQTVLRTHPNKFFGTLAYMELAEPPKTVRLHQNIIPFLTEDRLRWVDPNCKTLAQNIVESWRNCAKRFGFYDYIYGSPYLLPRVYFHHMADVYQYAAQNNVWAVYAEAYPNWGEGPKLYLTTKLFWNPFLDVDSVLKDWYECCAGKQAAPYLEQYFSLWERFWTQKILNTPWFKNKSMYMAFWSPAYLDMADISDIDKSRQLLEKALLLAETDLQKKRVQMLFKAFEYYEASAIAYWGLKSHRFNISKNVAIKMNQKRYRLIETFKSDPLLSHPTQFNDGNRFPHLRFY